MDNSCGMTHIKGTTTGAYLQIHIAVLLFGFTALFGRWLSISEISIVWYRVALTSISLFLFPVVRKEILRMPIKELLTIAATGIVVSLHWVFFFSAVKLTNVSVTLSCLATASFFTAFLEPLFSKSKIKKHEVILSLFVIPGMYFIHRFSDFNIGGILIALLSALLAAVFGILNKKWVKNRSAHTITFIELFSGSFFLLAAAPLYLKFFPSQNLIASPQEMLYLCFLAFFCTTLAYVLSIKALKHLSAFSTSLAINLEPVYGIFLAIWLFDENQEVDALFYVGTGLILLAVFLQPVLEKLRRRKNQFSGFS